MKSFIVLTLFPNMFNDFINTSIISKALSSNKIAIKIVDIRNYSELKHNQVDDYQYGGGEGMVLMAPPVVKAIRANKTDKCTVILLSPQGKQFNQQTAQSLANDESDIMLVCGHYEGFDERIRSYVDLELSIGDYVLTGGELASMVVIDSISRLCDNVINPQSHINDSFTRNLLDYPVYTRPYEFENKKVPDVLVSGNHKLIQEWREYQAIRNTYIKRPDLLEKADLSQEQEKMLSDIKAKETRKED